MARNEKAMDVTSKIVDSRRSRKTREVGASSSSGSRTRKCTARANNKTAVARRAQRNSRMGTFHSMWMVQANRTIAAACEASTHQSELWDARAKSSSMVAQMAV